jgi:hypothetical protein
MVMAIIAISLSGFWRNAQSAELPSDTAYEQSAGNFSKIDQQCPACPSDQHSVPGHYDSSCNCPCHAPLTAQPVQLVRSQQIALFEFHEPFKSLPEVYLPKFIPPHILV